MRLLVIFLSIVFVILMGLSFSTAKTLASVSITPTPKPAPDPIVIFSTGESIDTTQNYSPKTNDICWTWNHIIGRIGNYFIPSGKQLVVIKFVTDQNTILVNNVACENDISRTPEERASWAHAREPWYYTWDKIVTYYVGANMQVVTLTPTLTPTATETETATASMTITGTNTVTRTPSATRTRTRTATRVLTRTPTVTAPIKPSEVFPANVSGFWIPKKGDVCYGEIVGNLNNSIVEFIVDYQIGIRVRNGGCFSKSDYTLGDILRYLNLRGIRYKFESLPKPTLTPSQTLVPTVTIVPFIPVTVNITGKESLVIKPGTICWGREVSSYEYKVVKFHRKLAKPIEVLVGGCHFGFGYSAEDVYNYLRRTSKIPLNGFVDVR
jgi:hypothetical protein